MNKTIFALGAAAACLGSALLTASARPLTTHQVVQSAQALKDEAPKVEAPKVEVVELKVCPMTLEEVQGEGAGNETVGNVKVFFCCAPCQPAFNALSKEDKDKKIAVALKAQQDKKKAK